MGDPDRCLDVDSPQPRWAEAPIRRARRGAAIRRRLSWDKHSSGRAGVEVARQFAETSSGGIVVDVRFPLRTSRMQNPARGWYELRVAVGDQVRYFGAFRKDRDPLAVNVEPGESIITVTTGRHDWIYYSVDLAPRTVQIVSIFPRLTSRSVGGREEAIIETESFQALASP